MFRFYEKIMLKSVAKNIPVAKCLDFTKKIMLKSVAENSEQNDNWLQHVSSIENTLFICDMAC
jgi:hypothetical protein